jgi:hypothetical protein
MTATDNLEIDPPQAPSCDELTRLGDALDHAEFVERIDELQRQNWSVFWTQHGRRFAPTADQVGENYPALEIPYHPAAAFYRVALANTPSPPLPELDLKDSRARFRAAAEDFYKRCLWRTADVVEWCDGGKFVSVRAILDAQHVMVKAREALDKIEQQVCTPIVRRFPRRRPSVRSV